MVDDAKNRRVVRSLAVGGLLIVIVLGFLVFRGGGSDTPKASPDTTPVSSGSAAKSPSTPGAPQLPRGSFDVTAFRDPFEPPIDLTSPAAGDTTGAATTAGSTATDGSTTATAAASTSTTTAAPSQNPVTTQSVALLEVNGTSAKVQVGHSVYTVSSGQTFATSYKLVSLSGNCGAFLYGDSSFSLCTGEQVIK